MLVAERLTTLGEALADLVGGEAVGLRRVVGTAGLAGPSGQPVAHRGLGRGGELEPDGVVHGSDLADRVGDHVLELEVRDEGGVVAPGRAGRQRAVVGEPRPLDPLVSIQVR